MSLSKGQRLLLLGVLLVVIDQVIKVLVKTQMTLGEHIPVLGNWFQLLFVENKGMAFGMSFGGVIGKYALTVFRIVLFGALVWWISKLLKREKPVPTGVLVGLTLITAGALGNIIDCLFYGLVFSESTLSTVATLGHYAPLMQGKVVDRNLIRHIHTVHGQFVKDIIGFIVPLRNDTEIPVGRACCCGLFPLYGGRCPEAGSVRLDA